MCCFLLWQGCTLSKKKKKKKEEKRGLGEPQEGTVIYYKTSGALDQYLQPKVLKMFTRVYVNLKRTKGFFKETVLPR